jgi:hypothetical protein
MAMDGWIEPNAEDRAAAIGVPAAKRQAVVNREEKEAELNALILSLQNAQLARQLSGCTWWTVLIPSELGTEALITTKKHADVTRGVSNHNKGSPHIQLWRTLLRTLIDLTSGNVEATSDVDCVKQFVKEMESKSPDMGHAFVAQARLKVVKDPKTMILFYSLSGLLEPPIRWKMDSALHRFFQAPKAVVKPGTAPPTEAEKKVQARVDKLRIELGLK